MLEDRGHAAATDKIHVSHSGDEDQVMLMKLSHRCGEEGADL